MEIPEKDEETEEPQVDEDELKSSVPVEPKEEVKEKPKKKKGKLFGDPLVLLED